MASSEAHLTQVVTQLKIKRRTVVIASCLIDRIRK
jgi:hypothetical protein